jgi:hypothetical protein
MTETTAPKSILARMGNVYLGIESYRDSGYQSTCWYPGLPNERITRTSFVTHFRRPNFFRFEWTEYDERPDGPRRSIIWCDGKKAYNKYSFADKVERDCLPMIVAGATGVSHGIAHTVSTLLMPDIGGNKVTDLDPVSYVESDNVRNEECDRIRYPMEPRRECQTDLWISKTRSILLRIRDEYVLAADPLEKLRKHRFKSLGGFLNWLSLARHSVNLPKDREPMPINRETHYEQIDINLEIPTETFSVDGPPINTI